MLFVRSVFINSAFKAVFRQYRTVSEKVPVVKVLSVKDDDFIKLSFKYSDSHNMHLKVPKDEGLQVVLSKIKRMASLQRQKQGIREAVANKYFANSQVVLENNEELVDVYLIQNDQLLDENIANADAWSQASILKIGDILYEVKYNTPTVIDLTLPEYILSGCAVRPHFVLECANINDCIFKWYRSVPFSETAKLKKEGNDSDSILIEGNKCWLKTNEGLIYFSTEEDIGCQLKVICTPKRGDKAGNDSTAESKNVVEAAPEIFPFEDRHAYTKTICDHNYIRCVSYNILANIYVERRKFPYASRKARDVYYRKQLLLKELLGYNSDIICLQEVQERVFEYDLVPVLNEAGYNGIYIRKGGRRYEGLSTFFRKSKYRILKNYSNLLNDIIKQKCIFVDLLTKVSGNYKDMSKLLAQDTAIQVSILEDIELPEYKFVVANTHLYSNKDTPEVRLMQAAFCTYYLEYILKKENLESVGILFCGDFNSLPDSETYNFMTSGNFECCPTWKNNDISVDSSSDTTVRHNLHLNSACGTPEYTNYTEEFRGCLDYIFYSTNSLEVTEIVPLPSHENVTVQVGLPNEYMPSDHIALVCTLKWKNKDS